MTKKLFEVAVETQVEVDLPDNISREELNDLLFYAFTESFAAGNFSGFTAHGEDFPANVHWAVDDDSKSFTWEEVE